MKSFNPYDLLYRADGEHKDSVLFPEYRKVKKVFMTDPMFLKLMKVMEQGHSPTSLIDYNHAVNFVLWWLYRTNISCLVSGLTKEEHFQKFALFLITENENKMLRETKNVAKPKC